MAQKKQTKKPTKKSAAASDKPSKGFTKEEIAAMREYARERRAESSGAAGANQESEVLAKIAEMGASDRAMGERIHALVKANAPDLSPKLWYGMPSYARDGKVVCFFQSGEKFKTRYATLGFSDKATLDDGPMWPTAFALRELTADAEARIVALLRKAVR